MRFNLRKALFILPNLFTLSSVFCGFYAILICGGEPSAEELHRAALLLVFAGFFDAMDGRVARMTKTQSAFGVQMDSLADVLSFGLAPAVLIYKWSLDQLGVGGLMISFVFLACGAIRLARFNVLASAPAGAPQKPSKYFTGLPIPGAAGILICLVIANYEMGGSLPRSPVVVAGIMGILAFFMVSTVRFRTFKDLRLSKLSVGLSLLGLGVSAAVAVQLHAPVVALVVLLSAYVLFALVEMVLGFARRGTHGSHEVEGHGVEEHIAEEEEPEPSTPGGP